MRLLLLLLVLIQVPLAVYAEENKAATMTVHGEAVTKIAPDQVILPVTIREENISITVAKSKHDEKLRALLKLAANTGIEKTDTQTRYTSINPVYDYNNNGQKLRGYQVESSVDFKINDLMKLGDFMNKVIGLGITEVGSVSYSLKDEDKVKEDTLAQALDHAYAKATRLASVAKLSVDKPLAIEEGEPVITRPIRPMPMMRTMSMATSAESAPTLPAGEIEIRQSITVTYQLK